MAQLVCYPIEIDLSISNYKDVSSAFSNAYGKSSDNTSSYAEWGLVTGGSAKSYTCWAFDLSSIPSNATITNVTCSARCSNTNASALQGGNTTVSIGVTDGSQYVNKQNSDTPAFGKEATVVTVSSTDYTREELDNFRLKIQAARGFFGTNTSYHTKFYGATLTIDYTIPTTYTVRFLDWDDSVISTQTVTSGGSATPPPNPTRDGYTFTGWDKSFTNITANTDIHAQYTKNSSGGGEVDTSVKNIKIGNSTIDKLYLGTTQILKAYLGSILLYSYSTGGTGGGDTPVIGNNYQLYTGYPLIVENSSLDTNHDSYITEIVGNTTQGVSNEVTSQQIVDSINYYVPNIARVNDDGTMTTLKATIDTNDITDDTHFIQLKPNTTYIFYCKRIETGGNPSMSVFLGGSLDYEWLQMTTEGVVLTTNDTGKVLIWIPSAQDGLLNVIVQEGTSLSLESSIRSVGVLQGDGTYKVDIIASNQNGSQTQTKSIYLPQPLRMIEEYSDRLYWNDTLGKCCIEQKIFKTIIDPYDEAIYIDNILTNGKFRVVLNLNQSDYFSGWYASPWPTMCNKMPTTTHASWGSVTETSIYFSQDGNCIVVFLESEVSDLDTARSYLQNLGEIEVYGKYDTPVIVETDITDKILFNTYANYTKVITDEKEVAPISMSGNFACWNLWDGVSYLPGRVDDNPTWGEYTGQYTDNWSLIDPYGIQFDITSSSMRGFTLQFENLTSGKYLNFTGKSNQPRYNYPEINFYFFDSSKTYLSKVRTGISSDGIEPEVILTNGEMFASVLIPDNATCCEMTFKLSIDDSIVPKPQHIEITNINVIETDGGLA